MPTLLQGRRVSLRPVERAYLPQLQAWFSDYELARLMNPGTLKPLNAEGELAWFEGMLKDGSHTFAVFAGEQLIGSCGLHHLDHKNRHGILGLAIADPAERGKGYGTEVMQLLLEWGFLELNLNRIALYVFEYNPNARKLYERLGFRLEGTLRASVFREGRYWDNHLMAILRSEYTPDPKWGLAAPAGT